MAIEDIIKNRIIEFNKEKNRIEVELTALHIKRNKGQEINSMSIKILNEELEMVKKKIKFMKGISKKC